jgi:hypothetical protein
MAVFVTLWPCLQRSFSVLHSDGLPAAASFEVAKAHEKEVDACCALLKALFTICSSTFDPTCLRQALSWIAMKFAQTPQPSLAFTVSKAIELFSTQIFPETDVSQAVSALLLQIDSAKANPEGLFVNFLFST